MTAGECLFGRMERPGGTAGELAGGSLCLGENVGGWKDSIGEANGERLFCSHLAPGVDDVLRPLEPDQALEPLGASSSRDETELDLWLTDLGVIGQISKVGPHR